MGPTLNQFLELVMKSNDPEILGIVAAAIDSRIFTLQKKPPHSPDSEVTDHSLGNIADTLEDNSDKLIVEASQIQRLSKETQKCRGPYPALNPDDLKKGTLSYLPCRDFTQFVIKNSEGICSFKKLSKSFDAWIETTEMPLELNKETLRTWISRWVNEKAISYVPGFRGNYSMTNIQSSDAQSYNPYLKKPDLSSKEVKT